MLRRLVQLLGTEKMKTIIILLSCMTMVRSKKVLSRVKREPIINGIPIRISSVPYFVILCYFIKTYFAKDFIWFTFQTDLQASIVEKDTNFQKWYPVCGATIISNTWLLTAAHCIQPPIEHLKIRTGVEKYFLPRNKEDDRHLHDIHYVIAHPNFTHKNIVNFNDIALIKLRTPIVCIRRSQEPIKLASDEFDLKVGLKLTIMGFGLHSITGGEENSALSLQMLYGEVKVLKKEDCEEIYKEWSINTTNHHFCATSSKYEVAKGDSGGPAVYGSQLIGIISSGGQGADQYPGLYIDIRKYIDWIRNYVEPEIHQPKYGCCAFFLVIIFY